MATPAAVLSILVEANTAGAAVKLTEFQGQLEKAGLKTTELEAKTAAMASGVNRSTGKAETSMWKLAKGVLAAGAAFEAFHLAKDAIANTVDLGKATLQLTRITGADTKTASTWIEVMKTRGLSTSSASMAFITLERNIHNAEEGSTTATAAFQQLGISQQQLRDTSPTDMIASIADGLSKLQSPAERAAIAQQLFSRGAKALIPILSQGSKGIEENLHAAQQYGAYLPNNTKAIQAAVEASHKLEYAQQGLEIAFTQAVLPALVKVGQGVLQFISQMRNGTGAGGQFATAISGAFRVVKDVVGGVVSVFGGLGNTIKIALVAFAAYKVTAFTAALVRMFEVIRASPIGMALTAVGLLATALFGLKGAQDQTATSARDLAAAWRDASHAANDLADAHLSLLQARTEVTRTALDEVTAQRALNQAVRQYGPDSIQARYAQVNLTDAVNAHKRALQGVKDAQQTQGDAQRTLTNTNHKAITTGKQLIKTDKDRIATLKLFNKPISDISKAEQQLAIDTGKVRRAQDVAKTSSDVLKGSTDRLKGSVNGASDSVDRLRGTLNRLPAHKRVQVEVDVGLQGFMPAVRMLFPGWHGGSLSQTAPPGLQKIYTGAGYTPPSQTTANQITAQRLANAGAAGPQIAFDQRMLAADRAMLQFTRGQARLALLQEIGSLQSNITSLETSTAATKTSTSATKHSTAAAKAKAAADRAAAAAAAAKAAADRAAAAALARWTAYWARIPSQATGQQILMQMIQNRLGLAQQAFGGKGDVAAERKDTNQELRLLKSWLSADEHKLRRINKQLASHGLSRKQRSALLQDKLALLQEIGTIQSNMGQAQGSLASLAAGNTASSTTGGGTGDTSQFDLTPTGGQVTLPTFLDINKSVQGAGGRHVHHHHGNVTVNVHSGADVGKVADAIDHATGGHLHAKLRAAGLRGT